MVICELHFFVTKYIDNKDTFLVTNFLFDKQTKKCIVL